MSSLISYKGLQTLTPEPTADGGKAINDNFTYIADALAAGSGSNSGTSNWPPTATNYFRLYNWDTSSLLASGSTYSISSPLTNDNNSQIVGWSLPLSTWAMQSQIITITPADTYIQAGLCLYDPISTKVALLCVVYTGNWQVQACHSASPTSGASAMASTDLSSSSAYLKMVATTSTIAYQYSTDGTAWTTLYTEPCDAYAGFTVGGLYLNPVDFDTTSGDAAATLEFSGS